MFCSVLMATTNGLYPSNFRDFFRFLRFSPIGYLIFDQKWIIFPQKEDTQIFFLPFLHTINPQIPEFHKEFPKSTLYDPL